MSPCLMDLPPELILQIVNLLIEEDGSACKIWNNDPEKRSSDLKATDEHEDSERGATDPSAIDKEYQRSQHSSDNGIHRTYWSIDKAFVSFSRAQKSLYQSFRRGLRSDDKYIDDEASEEDPKLQYSEYHAIQNTDWSSQQAISSAAIQYLCSTDQVTHVKVLHFLGKAPGSKKDNFHDVEGVFPIGVGHILSNLSQFPKLETLVIDFDFDLIEDNYNQWDTWSDVFFTSYAEGDEYETREEIERAERQEGWMALMMKTFNAVSTHKSNTVPNLIIRDCPVRANSVFGNEKFNEWLRALESLTFDIYGGDIGAYWTVNSAPCFWNYITHLDQYFFNALENVTRLAVIGHKGAAIGQTCDSEALVPLKPEHTPKLKELELGYYFIQDDLVPFLIAHSSTLKHLTFDHCYFEEPFFDEIPITNSDEDSNERERTWNLWFRDYAAKQPSTLTSVTFRPHNGEITNAGYPPDHEFFHESRKEFAKPSKGGKEHRVFPYGTVDSDRGTLFESEAFNMQKAFEGSDLDGWYELLEVMENNWKRVSV
ncbi:hypothetical protein ACLMJK_001350 [Lecanora helva]